MQNIDSLSKNIISDPLFLKLKNVIENNAYHDNETVYSHLLKTFEIAKREIKGDFIKNEEAKKLFLNFINENAGNQKRKDLMLITALVHDIGKILFYKDGESVHALRHVNPAGTTRMPGHEYWGSVIIGKILKNTSLSKQAATRITYVVRLHDTFNEPYFKGVDGWPIEKIVDDVKARAENLYMEALFNIYCDCFNAKPADQSRVKIIEIFSSPSLYLPREYFIK